MIINYHVYELYHQRIMNAHFLKETIAPLFLFFSGVFLLGNTVRLTKKTNGIVYFQSVIV